MLSKINLLYASLVIFIITFLILMISTKTLAASNTTLYIISDKNFVGDRNQLLGVANASQKYFASKGITLSITEYDFTELNILKEKIAANDNMSMVVSAGYYGIDSINLLKSTTNIGDKIIAVHLSHQLLNSKGLKHSHLVRKDKNSVGADMIAVPMHVLNADTVKQLTSDYTILVQTVGVAHNLEATKIQEEYNKHKDILPKADKYLVVMLAGDAPDSKGKMHYYTAAAAEKLAKYSSNLAKEANYTVLVTNGPRTGKHDHKTGKELDVHKNGTIDQVTLKFSEILKQNNITFKLFDFQKDKPNYKEVMLGAVLYNAGSKILLPGESTSVISEAIDVVPSDGVIIYYNPAMSEAHKKHIQSEFSKGTIDILDRNMRIKHRKITAKTNKQDSASTEIAQEIYNLWNKSQ